MDDLIKRQDAIDACLNGYSANVYDCVDEIKKLPSTDTQEKVYGKWLEKEVIHNHANAKISEFQSARCSVCNKYHTTPYMYYFDNYNYCPNCGADMRGEGDEIQGKK